MCSSSGHLLSKSLHCCPRPMPSPHPSVTLSTPDPGYRCPHPSLTLSIHVPIDPLPCPSMSPSIPDPVHSWPRPPLILSIHVPVHPWSHPSLSTSIPAPIHPCPPPSLSVPSLCGLVPLRKPSRLQVSTFPPQLHPSVQLNLQDSCPSEDRVNAPHGRFSVYRLGFPSLLGWGLAGSDLVSSCPGGETRRLLTTITPSSTPLVQPQGWHRPSWTPRLAHPASGPQSTCADSVGLQNCLMYFD